MIEEDKLYVPAEELFSIAEEIVNEGKQIPFIVSGMSMWPLLMHGRDTVILEKCDIEHLSVGAIVLVKTPVNKYLLHRVSSVKGEYFETTGDGNCFRDGYFHKSTVVAYSKTIIRKGKKIDLSLFCYRILMKIWLWGFPVRKHLLRIIQIPGIRRILQKFL